MFKKKTGGEFRGYQVHIGRLEFFVAFSPLLLKLGLAIELILKRFFF